MRQLKGFIQIIFLLSITLSCDKSSVSKHGSGNSVNIVVNAKLSGYTEGGVIQNRKANLVSPLKPIKDTIFSLNNDYDIYATILPVDNINISSTITSQNINKLSSTSPLGSNIYYKLVVYTSTGEFKTERIYQRGNESATQELLLDGGETYTFVAYSINSTDLNSLNQVASSFQSKTLSNSSISISDNIDLLIFKTDRTISGEATDYLEIVFKHVFNKINVIIDASLTGYNVEEVDAILSSSNSVNTINFSDNAIVPSGVQKTQVIDFGLTSTTIRETTPFIFNGTNGGTSLRITKLKIGSIEEGSVSQPLTPFTNISLTSGEAYNLKFRIIPKDRNDTDTIVISGDTTFIPVAIIGGLTWMKHNAGVTDYTLNPLQNPSIQALVGNYYQWGRDAVYATTATPSGPIPNCCLNSYAGSDLWSPGKPIATTLCPSGFRVPTRDEFAQLVDMTTASNQGTFLTASDSNDPTNFSASKILTSKRNTNVKLAFPAAGVRDYSDGSLARRGFGGYYWSSNFRTENNQQFYHLVVTAERFDIGYSVSNWGFNVRCIKRNQLDL